MTEISIEYFIDNNSVENNSVENSTIDNDINDSIEHIINNSIENNNFINTFDIDNAYDNNFIENNNDFILEPYSIYNFANEYVSITNEDSININNKNIIGSYTQKFSKKFTGGKQKIKEDPLRESTHASIVPLIITECSLIKGNANVCSSNATITKIKETLNINKQSPVEIIDEAKKMTKCDSERCVVTNVINDETSKYEIMKNFKINGPTGIELLNNFNIDKTIKQWQLKFPQFYAYNFNMRDFKRQGDSLATVDIYNDIWLGGNLEHKGKGKPVYDTFACVINSDVYSGGGLHWMALFGDFRNPAKYTVEFFNSSGQAPSQEFGSWLLTTDGRIKDIIKEENKSSLNEVIKVCTVKQQDSRTECGVYSLYYIWARLNGIPYKFFLEHRIEDEKMFEFRQHLFNSNNATHQAGETFKYEKFTEKITPKWE